MKLASLKNGRDGRLVVVSRDLSRCADASAVAPTMQAALDDWDAAVAATSRKSPTASKPGASRTMPFDPAECASPLPRAYQWLDGSAYVNHVALVRQARGAEMPADVLDRSADVSGHLGRRSSGRAIRSDCADEAWGIDLEAEVAVVARRCADGRHRASRPPKAIQLDHAGQRRDAAQSHPGRTRPRASASCNRKPPSAFTPVAVTPDELGKAWDGTKVDLPLLSFINGKPFGRPVCSVDMTFDFPTLIMHAAKTRPLGAGTILGSGTVSNRDADGGPGKPISEGGLGYSCIAEQRTVETILHGKPSTPFLKFGDRVRIEMNDKDGRSIFGAIDQEVVRYTPPK